MLRGRGELVGALYDQVIFNVLGGHVGTDAPGGHPVSIMTIDSDGGLEPVDSLRACGDGFTALGLNVFDHPISAVYDAELFRVGLGGQESLCAAYRACPLHDICGSGYLPHRFSTANGFDDTTVYCRDLWKVISHIVAAVSATAARSRQAEGVAGVSAPPLGAETPGVAAAGGGPGR
ncbi:MAG TPA: hypothetical protein VHQ90_01045 [Thermoanaerobaculia bacterium]|nr:hypothetical protein [Thermoanaerobaculia bacterium]